MRHRLARRLRQYQHARVNVRIDLQNLSPPLRIMLRSPSEEIHRVGRVLLSRLDANDELQTVKLLCQKKISDAAAFALMLSSPSPKILSTIVSAWMRDGNSKACLSSGLELIDRGVHPTKNVLTTLIRAAGICNRFDIINRLWHSKSLFGIKADSRMHAAHISACGRIGLVEFQQSYQALMASGIPHDCYTYCASIHALSHLSAQANSVERRLIADRSEKLFAEMLSGGITPTTVSMNVLINALCKCGEVQRALQILKHFGQRMVPDLFTFAPLLDALVLKGQIQACGHLIAEMLARGILPNGIVLSSLLHGSKLNGVKPFLVWQTYQLVIEQQKDVNWDNLAQSVIIQSVQHVHAHIRDPLCIQLIQDHCRRTQNAPERSMLIPLIVDSTPKKFMFERFLAALQEYGPDRSLINFAFRSAIQLGSVKLCMLLSDICWQHRALLDDNTAAVLLTFLVTKLVSYPYNGCAFLPIVEKLRLNVVLDPAVEPPKLLSLSSCRLDSSSASRLRCSVIFAAANSRADFALASLDQIFNPSLDNILLRIFTSSNDLPSVLALLEKRPFLASQPILLDLYRRTKSIALIDQRIQSMITTHDCCYHPLQVDRVIRDLSRLGHLKRCYDLILCRQQVLPMQIRSDSLNSSLTLFARSSLPEICESVLSATNPQPNLTCFNILIHAYCKLQDFNKIAQVRTRLRLAGLLEDTVTFNTLLCYALQTKQASLISSLYDEMKLHGIPINSRTLTCLVNAASLCSRPLNWFVEEIESSIGSDEPGPYLCEAIIRVFGSEGLNLIQSRWPDVLAQDWTGVVWARIIRVFGLKKASYNGPLRANILNVLLTQQSSIQALRILYKSVIEGKMTSNSYTFPALIRALSRNGCNPDDLRILFQRMLEFGYGLNSAVVSSMINALGKHYAIAQCQEVFDLARRECLPLTESVYTAMIRAHARLGDIHACQLLLDQMRQRHVCPTVNTFNALLTACRVKGNLSLAHRMLSLLNDLQLQPSIGTYHELLRLYASKGYIQQCQDIINHIRNQCEFEHDRITYGLYKKAKNVSRQRSCLIVSRPDT